VERSIVLGQTAHEYFKEAVSGALAHRRLRIQEGTEFYLVNLLAGHLASGAAAAPPQAGAGPEPLAFILKRALEAEREERRRALKRLGDTSLFVSGFFGDSLARSLVDVGYYIAMGERAYGSLAGTERGLDGLFEELSARFGDFVDLFAEIAELSSLRSNRGLLRLYERFVLTRDERVAEKLRARGVALFSGPGAVVRPPRGVKH